MTASWLSQLRDAQAKEPEATVFALATIANESTIRPRVRHTLFLDIVESSDEKTTYVLTSTSAKSSKVKHLLEGAPITKEGSVAEIAWLFPKQQLQFRILAKGHIVPHPKHHSHMSTNVISTSLANGKTWDQVRAQEAEKLSCQHLQSKYAESNNAEEDFVLLALEAQEVTINKVGGESQHIVL
ncbi:hypothetical protein CBS101457_005104 [Exobasidium rhododendri]|nr:hypothetical protein CBS101457_005104 [Exobasidium rhododendri]